MYGLFKHYSGKLLTRSKIMNGLWKTMTASSLDQRNLRRWRRNRLEFNISQLFEEKFLQNEIPNFFSSQSKVNWEGTMRGDLTFESGWISLSKSLTFTWLWGRNNRNLPVPVSVEKLFLLPIWVFADSEIKELSQKWTGNHIGNVERSFWDRFQHAREH